MNNKITTPVFERETNKGHLTCSVVTDNSTFTDYQAVTVLMELDGQRIHPLGSASVKLLDDNQPKPKGFDIQEPMRSALLECGAVGCWGMKVALFNDEPALINKAIAEAWIQRNALKEKVVNDAGITVTKHLYNSAPARAENSQFTWWHAQPDHLTFKKSGEIYHSSNTDTTSGIRDAANMFFRAIHILTRWAEKDYEEKLSYQSEADYKKWRNQFDDLSDAELEFKANEYDRAVNESGEGSNPYRY